ncbi:hypothetical protein AB0H36_41110 [Kribbella sp. NPDC050820]|uniref:hypothetical protein n=1 Tax=Kribbella sp. NPDC050820 TaxID=3155408 RepID=UPI0033E40F5B
MSNRSEQESPEHLSAAPTPIAPEQVASEQAPEQAPEQGAVRVPELPWRVPLDPAPWWAWALFVTPFVAVPALNSWLWMGARDMLAVGLLTIIGASVVRVAGGVVLYRVMLTPTGLKARTSMLIRSVSWQDVDRIEVGDDNVVLVRGPDESEINGIPKDRTAYVGAVIQAIRAEAANHPPRRHRPRPGIGTLLVLTYLTLSVGAFLIRWHIV